MPYRVVARARRCDPPSGPPKRLYGNYTREIGKIWSREMRCGHPSLRPLPRPFLSSFLLGFERWRNKSYRVNIIRFSRACRCFATTPLNWHLHLLRNSFLHSERRGLCVANSLNMLQNLQQNEGIKMRRKFISSRVIEKMRTRCNDTRA